jgi:hypothetical protein
VIRAFVDKATGKKKDVEKPGPAGLVAAVKTA